jgi:hypothetical protein
MERTIHIESAVLAIAGLALQLAGWIASEPGILLGGVFLSCCGLFAWVLRLGLLRQRIVNIPGMVFVSQQGVEAILPDTHAVSLSWDGLRARQITLHRRFLPKLRLVTSARRFRHRSNGLALRSAAGITIYVTDELDGYDEFLDILDEMNIRLESFSSHFLGVRGAGGDVRRRIERQTRVWRN